MESEVEGSGLYWYETFFFIEIFIRFSVKPFCQLEIIDVTREQ